MKKIQLLSLLLLSILLLRCAGGDERPRTIERPVYGLQNSQTLEIDKILLTDSSTVLYIDAYFYPGNWIRIDSGTYIQADGMKYKVERSEDIILNDYHWMPESGEDHFALIFPVLPKGTKTIDFIESDCDDCFKIWDIDLTGKPAEYKSELPKEILDFKANENYTLPEPQFKTGETTVTVNVIGLKEGYSSGPVLMIPEIFTESQNELEPEKLAEGKYQFKFEQYNTLNAMLYIANKGVGIRLQPGDNAEVYFDIAAYSKTRSRYNPQPDLVYIGFKGQLAEINNQMVRYVKEEEREEYQIPVYDNSDILDMTTEQYVDYIFNTYKKKSETLNQSTLPNASKQIINLELRSFVISGITQMEQIYMYLHRQKNNPENAEQTDFIPPKATTEELKRLKELNLNDPMFVYLRDCPYIVSSITYNTDDALLNELTGSETGLLQDLKKIFPVMKTATSGNALTPEAEGILKSASPYYLEVYNRFAEKAKKQLEEAMAKGGFEMMGTPAVKPDKVLDAIVAQYKGKPVFVDFWATWCGPCLNAMKTIKPIKPEMKEKGVVSIYISGVTSPKTKWLTMLPDIGGIHYYLTDDEWKTLREKYDIKGIPTYMIFDKNGKKAFEATGYPGNDKILEELKKVW